MKDAIRVTMGNAVSTHSGFQVFYVGGGVHAAMVPAHHAKLCLCRSDTSDPVVADACRKRGQGRLPSGI
jgi:hypothetical protein